jgi:hypothetical protein
MSATRSWLGVVLAVALVGAAAPADAAALKVERRQAGLRVVADDVPLEEVLDALAASEDFDVVMQPGVERPPVDVDLRDVSLEQALRRILRRRSYAISYQETEGGLAVSRVQVLLPGDTAVDAAAAPRRPSPAAVATQERRRALELQQARERAERARQRRLWVERAREAQRRREAALQAAAEPAPLRRLLWGRSR